MACRELFHLSFWYLKSTIIVFLLLSPCLSRAASDGDTLWPTPGDEEGVLLETTTSPKTLGNYRVISDTNGGAIVVWTYVTSLTPSTYSAQLKASRIDHTGKKLWTGLVSYKAMSQTPEVIPDGAGGVIVAWAEGRADASGYKIYAQRLNAKGTQLWGTMGVPLSNSFSAHSSFPIEAAPVICPDNIGGAYVGWGGRLSRISPDGKVSPPGLDGIELIPGGKGPFQLISDGTGGPSLEVKPPPLTLAPSGIGLENVSRWEIVGISMIPGGAFAAWWDGSGQLFAQRIKAGLAWGAQGVLVGKHDITGGLDLIRDGESELIVAWSGSDITPQRTQIRTQRLDGNGKNQWTKNGALVLDSTVVGGNWPSAGTSISIASDGAAGLVVAWLDSRAADVDLYAQRVDSTGNVQWAAGGVLLPPYILSQVAPGAQGTPRIVADLKGGVIVTYQDKGQFSWDIAATRLNSKGNKLFSKWIRSDSLSQSKPGLDQRDPDIAYDASGPKLNGAIIVWAEREKPYRRLYVQKIQID